MSARWNFRAPDAVLCALLLLGTVAYLGYLPRDLVHVDESNFLYEAKRIRDGEVMYRDFFQFVTPGASYAMAFLFWVFGTTIDTARLGSAVLHGLTGVAMYATCRALRVRRSLALLAPMAYLAICHPAWRGASWHWFSTFLMVVVMLVLVGVPWPIRPRWAIVPGLVTGFLISVQQQKGAVVAAGVGFLFVLVHLVDRRRATWRGLAARLSFFAAGIALVVIPVLATCIVLAGVNPVFDALVRFPLENYGASVGGTFRASWGYVATITPTGFTPTVLKYLPLALLPACLRCVVGLVRGADPGRMRALLALIVSAGSAALSIWYFPDFIHIAFIAAVFLVGAAEALEWALSALIRPPLWNVAIGWAVAAALFGCFAVNLQRNALLLRRYFSLVHETAFGRVAFATPWEPMAVDAIRALVNETPARELFAYPFLSHLYLTTGAKNPTPFQWFFIGLSPPHHTEQVLEILTTRPVPYVVLGTRAGLPPALADVIREHYEPVEVLGLAGPGPVAQRGLPLALYRRKPPPATDPAPLAGPGRASRSLGWIGNDVDRQCLTSGPDPIAVVNTLRQKRKDQMSSLPGAHACSALRKRFPIAAAALRASAMSAARGTESRSARPAPYSGTSRAAAISPRRSSSGRPFPPPCRSAWPAPCRGADRPRRARHRP